MAGNMYVCIGKKKTGNIYFTRQKSINDTFYVCNVHIHIQLSTICNIKCLFGGNKNAINFILLPIDWDIY